MARRKPKQGTLEFRSWGGARKGAGRKRVGARKCRAHRKRIALKSYQPQHTTLRLVDAVASVRRWRVFAEIVSAIHASHRDGPTRDASTWLLQVGWRRLGLIQASEVPAS